MSTEFMNIDTSRSYANEANLEAALAKLGFTGTWHRHLVVRNRDGRFTAVFPFSNLQGGGPNDGNLTLYSRHGFCTLG